MTTTQQAPLHPKTVNVYTNFVRDHFEQIPLTEAKDPQRLVDILRIYVATRKIPQDKISSNLGQRVAKLDEIIEDPELPIELEDGTFVPANQCDGFKDLIFDVTQKWLEQFQILPLEEWGKRVDRDKISKKNGALAKANLDKRLNFYQPPTERREISNANEWLDKLCCNHPRGWQMFQRFLPKNSDGEVDKTPLLSLQKNTLDQLFHRWRLTEYYLQQGMSIGGLALLQPHIRSLLYQHKNDIQLLLQNEISLQTLLSFPSPTNAWILEKPLAFYHLMLEGVDFREFYVKAGPERGDLFFKYAQELLNLIQSGASYPLLVSAIADETCQWILENPDNFLMILCQTPPDQQENLYTFPPQTLEFML